MPRMSPTGKGGKSDAWMDGADSTAQVSWQRRMGLQRQRRQATEALWGRLDELVHDWGKLPSPRKPCVLSTWNPCVQTLRPGACPAHHLLSCTTPQDAFGVVQDKLAWFDACSKLVWFGTGEKMVLRYGNHRAQALKSGRTREELLKAATTQIRMLMEPHALEQAYTTRAGAGLLSIVLKSGKIASQSPCFQDLAGWVPAEARGNIRVSLEASDGHDFDRFCQSVVRDAGEPFGETFTQCDKVVGRSITVRFFTRAPGPPGLRNPEWLLLMRAVKLTLVGVQPQLAGDVNAAGKTSHPMPD